MLTVNIGTIHIHANDKTSALLITNRKSHISFRLVPNLVALDDLERRYSPNCSVISPILQSLHDCYYCNFYY